MDNKPVAERTAVIAETMKCMSKSVNYDQPEVEKVVLSNFKYLFLVCAILFIVSLTVLFFENVQEMMKQSRVSPE